MPTVDLLLRDVAPATRSAMDAACRSDRFAVGEEILGWGEKPTRLHHLVDGRARVWRPDATGHSVVLFFLQPGDSAGVLATCRGRPGVATITAVEPLRTKSWPVDLVHRLLFEDPQMATNALDIIGRRAELLADRVQDLSVGPADRQLARALLRLVGEDGEWTDAHEATVPVTRQDLADMTRSTLHTASRTLSGWEMRHWVRSTRGRVTITDPAALAEVAGLAA